MDIQEVARQEKENTGTSWTKHKTFDRDGFFIIRNLCNPEKLVCSVPEKKGRFDYDSNNENMFEYFPVENQVNGSVARYWYPKYKEIHTQIRLILEKEIGRSLYNTYYYDRFYFPGQELKIHTDRDACEISITLHIGTNLNKANKNWPIWIKTPDTYNDQNKKEILKLGEDKKIILNAGDAMVYKGCERPHWREPMPGLNQKRKNLYYHQIFFHYVLQDGQRAHCAWDAAR